MHDAAPPSCDPPPAPPVDTFGGHHHHPDDAPTHLPPHQDPPPDDPPPSYDDVVGVSGAPPGYGTFRHYTDDSSMASSEVETTNRALPEWFGQLLVVFVFMCLIYGFWKFVNSPDVPNGEWPRNGRLGPPST